MTNFERGFRDAVLKLAEEPSVRVVLREVVDDDENKTDSTADSRHGAESSAVAGKNTADTAHGSSSSSTNTVANTVSSSR